MKFEIFPNFQTKVIATFIHPNFWSCYKVIHFCYLDSKRYILILGGHRKTGLPDFEDSIFYLPNGYYSNVITLLKNVWWVFTLERCKCPQSAKNVADIYERVQVCYGAYGHFGAILEYNPRFRERRRINKN